MPICIIYLTGHELQARNCICRNPVAINGRIFFLFCLSIFVAVVLCLIQIEIETI